MEGKTHTKNLINQVLSFYSYRGPPFLDVLLDPKLQSNKNRQTDCQDVFKQQ